MSGNIPDADTPLTAVMATAEQCIEGMLYKVATAKLTKVTAKADEAIAVGAETSKNADGSAKSGDLCLVWNEGTRMVLTKAGTYQPWGLVYVSDDVDGYATPTDPTTGTIIGRAMIPYATTYVQGDMVPVALDIAGKNVTS